jgi:hypothetical protein
MARAFGGVAGRKAGGASRWAVEGQSCSTSFVGPGWPYSMTMSHEKCDIDPLENVLIFSIRTAGLCSSLVVTIQPRVFAAPMT